MQGLTDAEERRRQERLAVAADPRRARLRDIRAVFDITERHDFLPIPYTGEDRVTFYLTGRLDADDRHRMTSAETVFARTFGVTFTGRPVYLCDKDSVPFYYLLEATLGSGLKIHLKACAEVVAEKHGTEWVRLPAENPELAGTAAA